MSYLEEMDALAGFERTDTPTSPPYLNEMDSLAGISKETHQQDETNITRLIGESLAKGVIGLADIPQIINQLTAPGLKLLGLPTPSKELPLASTQIKKGLKGIGVDLDTQTPQTSGERILAHAGEFAGGLGPAGGLKSLSKIAKMTGLGAATGATSGLAQEAGVSPLAADIGASIATPLGIGAVKKGLGLAKVPIKTTRALLSPSYLQKMAEKEALEEASLALKKRVGEQNIQQILENIEKYKAPIEGYKPTVAEMADSPGFAQLQRTLEGIVPELAEHQAIGQQAIREALESLRPGGAEGIEATQEFIKEVADNLKNRLAAETLSAEKLALKEKEAFVPRITSEEAGEDIRKALSEKVSELEKRRREVTEPLYRELESIKEGVPTVTTNALLDQELKTAKGPIKKSLLEIKKLIEPNVGLSKEEKKLIESTLAEYEHISPGAKQQLEEQLLAGKSLHASPIELKNALEVISDKITTAKRAGENHLAYRLNKVKESLLDDLSHIPEEKAARQAYAELSEPITAITEHRTIGKAIARDEYGKDFLIGAAEIPSKIINKSMASIKDAKDLMTHIGDSPETIKSVKGYINNEIINKVTDNFGKVDIKKLEAWKRENPAAFLIDPSLEVRVKNLSNAQHFANETIKKNEKELKDFYKGALASFFEESPQKIVGSILRSRNAPEKMRKIVNVAAEDKSGIALEGLKREILDNINKNINLSSIDTRGLNNISYHKFRNYLNNNKKSLEEVFDKEQIKTLEQIEETLKRKYKVESVARAPGSPTWANKTIFEAMIGIPENAFRGFLNGFKISKATINFLYNQRQAIMKDAAENLIKDAVLDPEKAKLLLTHIGKKKTIEKLVESLKEHSSLLAVPVTARAKEKEEE